MAFTLVYTGEHFVIDILLGWIYAITIFVAGNRLFDRYERWPRQRATGHKSGQRDALHAPT
jgi:membrane-associated phospholipid phosphatase